MFRYSNSELFVNNVPVRKLAQRYGTPLYVYSGNTILDNYRRYEKAFERIRHLICFAVKSNPQNAILRLLAEHGAGADIVSGGELYRALRAGIPANRIVFAGVGKTETEIATALRAGILLFNAESLEELRLINRVASERKTVADVALRINPDVDAHTHPHIATGRNEDKFGIPIADAVKALIQSRALKNIAIRGLHMHLGSQIASRRPYEKAFRRINELLARFNASNISVDYLDIGGGAAIRYRKKETELKPEHLAGAIRESRLNARLKIILEPGRSIVGPAGILITRVLYRKKHFAIVDAGMNDLIRPALYGAYHEIIPVERNGRKSALISVAGPVCESSDFFGKKRRMQNVVAGDLLAIMDCGGYGSSMSSTYNSRPRAAEVLVKDKTVRLIRKRDTFADLVRNEL